MQSRIWLYILLSANSALKYKKIAFHTLKTIAQINKLFIDSNFDPLFLTTSAKNTLLNYIVSKQREKHVINAKLMTQSPQMFDLVETKIPSVSFTQRSDNPDIIFHEFIKDCLQTSCLFMIYKS